MSSSDLVFGAIPYRKDELMQSTTDLTKLKALNWKPKTSLEQGVRKTIAMEMKND